MPEDRRMPVRVWGPALAITVAVYAVLPFVPRAGLGDPFWLWLTALPLVELLAVLAWRGLTTDGADSWPPARRPRPLRDGLLIGIAMGVLLFVVSLADRETATVSLLSGLGIGLAFFAGFYYEGRRRLKRGMAS